MLMTIAVFLLCVSLSAVKSADLKASGGNFEKEVSMTTTTKTRSLFAASLLAMGLMATSLMATTARAQQYDVEAIRAELGQIQAYFNQCQSGFGQGMQDSLNTFLTTGQYPVTQLAQGCDYNTMAALNARAYQLSLMLARAEGATGQACEIMWMPGCPEPGMRKGRSLAQELMPKKE
jgi:hypothetical protein